MQKYANLYNRNQIQINYVFSKTPLNKQVNKFYKKVLTCS